MTNLYFILITSAFILFTSSAENSIGKSENRFEAENILKTLSNAGKIIDTKSHGPRNAACKRAFEGFGVHMGSIGHLTRANPQLIEELADTLYNDLLLRRFRTSYEPFFSPAEDVYDISCQNPFSCTWNAMHRAMSKYPDATYMASIWSPPYFMKNAAGGLKIDYESKYYQYIKIITQMIKSTFNQTIELVSLVNEPENFVVTWDHCNMGPHQICRMVETFNDPLVSACTENAWFSITNVYMDYNNSGVSCRRACKTILTHAYAVNFNVTSSDFLSASYDINEYRSRFEQPIWQTEVSSTYGDAHLNQMEEGLILAQNIIQFLGTTCVTRYYFWIAFTFGISGESLIWGDESEQKLTFPKKYFVYKHFTLADHENPKSYIKRCDNDIFTGLCLQFADINVERSTAVFINGQENATFAANLKKCDILCCTTKDSDYVCDYEKEAIIPPLSVCSCKTTKATTGSSNGHIKLELSFGVLIISIICFSFHVKLY